MHVKWLKKKKKNLKGPKNRNKNMKLLVWGEGVQDSILKLSIERVVKLGDKNVLHAKSSRAPGTFVCMFCSLWSLM